MSAADRRVCPSTCRGQFSGYFKSVIVELTGKSVQAGASLRNMMRYLASRVAHYSEFHRIAHFAGNLDHLKVAYANSGAETKRILSRQFDAIVNQLTDAKRRDKGDLC